MLTTMSDIVYNICEETTFYYCQPYKTICKFTMDLNPNDGKQLLLKTENSQKNFPFKALYPYKGTREVKDFQKLFKNEIYFTLQTNNTK